MRAIDERVAEVVSSMRGVRASSREERERVRDRWRFRLVFLGALLGGGLSLALVEATMGWVPNPGPMVPFTTFAGALLGLFSAAFVAAAIVGEELEEEIEATPAALEPAPRAAVPSASMREPFTDELALPPWVLDVHRPTFGAHGHVAMA